jgi:hypothetical protein
MGDMNIDGVVDSSDAPDFVEGLLNPALYKTNHCFVPATSPGDFSGDGKFDFDDIKHFSNEVESLSVFDIYRLISEYSVPEPATGGLLLAALGLVGATRWSARFRAGQVRRPEQVRAVPAWRR